MITTVTPCSSTLTSLMIPSSTTLSTGTSGSFTSSRYRHTAARETATTARRETTAPRLLERGRIELRPVDGVGEEHLSSEAPQLVDGVLHALVALGRTVAELDHPVGAVANVILRLLHRLRGDPGEIGIP